MTATDSFNGVEYKNFQVRVNNELIWVSDFLEQHETAPNAASVIELNRGERCTVNGIEVYRPDYTVEDLERLSM